MLGILQDMRVAEAAAFVAAPLGGTTLGRFAADMTRFGPIRGGLGPHRAPTTAQRNGLDWRGLENGKRSLAADAHTPEAREIVAAPVTAPVAAPPRIERQHRRTGNPIR